GYIVVGISADCFFHVLSHAIDRFFYAGVKYAGSGQSIPARACFFEETTKRTITPGKLADLVVLNADPTRLTVDEFKNLQADKTIIGGKVVWESPY
ncbi:MAG: amidohydrolase family protein, partial [bacterium]|nr:amidohydrolase family protein [bacterium]